MLIEQIIKLKIEKKKVVRNSNFRSKKICKEEGCNNPIWSKGVCKNHTPSSKKLKKTFPEKNQGGDNMRKFFLEIWKERPHVSEVSGTFLGHEPLSVFFHHILEKEMYPDLKYEKENIILLTLEEHDNVGMNHYKYPKINYTREKLKLKFNIT